MVGGRAVKARIRKQVEKEKNVGIRQIGFFERLKLFKERYRKK